VNRPRDVKHIHVYIVQLWLGHFWGVARGVVVVLCCVCVLFIVLSHLGHPNESPLSI
jgi:hypothetical protein